MFFRGEDEYDQLVKISKVLGSDDLYRCARARGRMPWRPAFAVPARRCSLALHPATKPNHQTKPNQTKPTSPPPPPRSYLDKYGVELDPKLAQMVGYRPRLPWRKFITPDNQHLATPEALDLLSGLLQYDHQERLTAKEALAHKYFSPVRRAERAERNAAR